MTLAGEAIEALTDYEKVGKHLVRIQDEVITKINDRSQNYLKTLYTEREKPLIGLDYYAERRFEDDFIGTLTDTVLYGEESLDDESLDLSEENRVCVIADLIDGTDLLLRNLGNWCSALVAFSPRDRKIISSFVLVNGGTTNHLFYCTWKDRYPWWAPVHGDCHRRALGRPDVLQVYEPEERKITKAGICSYAQKPKNALGLFRLLSHRKMAKFMGLHAKDKRSGVRLYNLAGNPMMCRLLQGGIDAVFDVGGQAPHDVVPGAYIALRGGATMLDLGDDPRRSDRIIEESDLVEHLYRPAAKSERLQYVIAANSDIASEIADLILSEDATVSEG